MLARSHDTAVVLAVLAILLSTYFFLELVGVADSGAAFWAPTAAALIAVLLLWRAARNSKTPLPEPVHRAKLTRRVLALVVLTYLSLSLVSGFVAGFVPPVPSGGSPDHSIAMGLRLATTVALPVSLILIFRVGRLSARWLTVKRPLQWLGVVTVVPTLVSLALHPVAIALARNLGSTPPRDLADKLPRAVAVSLLVFCALALGNLSGRKSPTRPPHAESPGYEAGLGRIDSGEVAALDQTTR